jgi:arginyl-tRNA synthetase
MQTEIRKLLNNAIVKLQNGQVFPHDLSQINFTVEHSKNKDHGEYASNIAMVLAKNLKRKPIDIAEQIAKAIATNENIKHIEIASPGFINFHLSDNALFSLVNTIIKEGEKFGRTDIGAGKMALVEFVSANPTGPLHVGHGRGAAFGDTVANLLEAMGYKTEREYYVNDAGRQMHILALSVWLRYLELSGEELHFPESGYKGKYVIEIAQKLRVEYKEKFICSVSDLYNDLPADESDGGDKEFYVDAMNQRMQHLLGKNDYQTIFQSGLDTILADIREDLEEFGVVFQEWFLESHLVKDNDIAKGIEKLKLSGNVYNKDDALWFRATKYGDEKDRVLIRANGQHTYFAADIGYHLNKYERGYDLIIDVFGADHHGYAPRIKGFIQAMNLDLEKLKILLVQFAILYRGKEKVSMSTRGGEFVTLRELREEVGNDASRFFYIMRKNDQHLDFDLELAKSKSADNPVYYVQYAHARICSVLATALDKDMEYDEETGFANLNLLEKEQEKNLLRNMLRYKSLLQTAALNFEPHLLAHYLRDLANDLHTYYNAEQFLVVDKKLRNARLSLITATKQMLANGLHLLGVSAPEAM